MTKRTKEKRTMPGKDPGFWQGLIESLPRLVEYLPITLLAMVTFAMGFIRGVHEGGGIKSSLLGAAMCTLLATPLFPVFVWLAESRGWPPMAAFPPCVFLAFLGTDWIREKADGVYDVFIAFLEKWLK